jgi:hypothetical protein
MGVDVICSLSDLAEETKHKIFVMHQRTEIFVRSLLNGLCMHIMASSKLKVQTING